MRFAIIGAMQEEVQGIKRELKDLKEVNKYGSVYYVGRIGKNDIVLTASNVGISAAASQLTSIILSFDIDYVINIGVCGGFFGKVNLLDVVVVMRAGYYDADATTFPEYAYGQIPRYPKFFECDNSLALGKDYVYGDIVSGDKFVSRLEQVENQISKIDYLNPICVDMESASFAQTAYKYNKPIMIVRTISDIIGAPNQGQTYRNILSEASNKSCKFILDILEGKWYNNKGL